VRALIFDLDGTLVDTVYGHVLAWQRAFEEAGLDIDGWRIHRRIGMSGGLFTRGVARAGPGPARETGARPVPGLRERALGVRAEELDRSLDELGVLP
jgi:beta-phosphoglucomutase-like phosphatase (HAD superfamily)